MSTSDRKSTRLNSSHLVISYAVFCLKKTNDRRALCRAMQFFFVDERVRRVAQLLCSGNLCASVLRHPCPAPSYRFPLFFFFFMRPPRRSLSSFPHQPPFGS